MKTEFIGASKVNPNIEWDKVQLLQYTNPEDNVTRFVLSTGNHCTGYFSGILIAKYPDDKILVTDQYSTKWYKNLYKPVTEEVTIKFQP